MWSDCIIQFFMFIKSWAYILIPLDYCAGINSDGNFFPWVERVDIAPNSCDRPERILSSFTLKEFLQTLPGWHNYYIGVLGQGSGWSNWGIITKLRASNRYQTAVIKSKLRSKNTSRKCSIPPSIKHSQWKTLSINDINGAILEPLPHAETVTFTLQASTHSIFTTRLWGRSHFINEDTGAQVWDNHRRSLRCKRHNWNLNSGQSNYRAKTLKRCAISKYINGNPITWSLS